MEKVIAVVVTYNRQQLLSECIDALRSQTRRPDTIFVVNNGSTDNTEAWLKSQNDISFISQGNTGSAGGFYTAIEYAFKNGYTWTWCMDDDGYPKNDALEELLNADNGEMKLLNCAVLDKEDKTSFVWNTGSYKKHTEVKEDVIAGVAHPFNGTLLHRKIVERVGLPKASFFLWGEETEYYYRITKINNIKPYTITKSIHYHPATRFTVKGDWDHPTGWKMYYYVRNRFPVLKAKFNNRVLGFLAYACFLIAFAGVIIVFQKTDRLRKLGFMFVSFKDALAGNFDTTPSTVLARLHSSMKYSNSLTGMIVGAFGTSHIQSTV
ncbi:MAG: glycosyltransferase [Chitinophagaceae bacterium]|nr:MAG: glycosyltransferase [Chitinophagaceae bacterium]